MPSVKVDARNLNKALRAHFEQLKPVLEAAAIETCHRGLAQAVTFTNAAGLVDLGGYKRGFTVTKGRTGPELRNDTPYAAVIEHGRRPNRPGPPFAPILAWAERKLSVPKKDLHRIAWAIRMAIHKRGSKPHKILFRTQVLMRVWFRAALERRLRTAAPTGPASS